MKKFLIFLVTLLTFCFNWVGCSGDEGNDDQSFITLSKNELEFDSNAGFQTVVVTSKDKWTVSGGTDWCDISSSSGSTGEMVTITVDDNLETEDRTTTIVFSCGNQTANLTILQYGIIESEYVDLKIEENDTELTYNENTGETVITYSDNSVPEVEIGQAFVLTEDYGYDIRKITGVSKSGKKLTLQTTQGDMCDLFKNIDFTLTTNPNLVSSTRSAGRVITPTSVEMVVGDKRTIIYEKSSILSREVYEYPCELFSLDDDFSGETLAEGMWGKLAWGEGSSYDIGLDAVFFFDFGEKLLANAKEGDLKTFKYYLDGNVDVDLLLQYSTAAEYRFEEKKIIKEKIIPTVEVKFMVGTIPVVVSLDADYGTRINMESEAGIEATSGVYIHSKAQVGLEYTKGKGIMPIESFTNNYGIHDPTLNIQGSAEADFAFFPRLRFKLYRCLGPWVDLIPYMKVGFEAGAQVSLAGNNYCSWGAKISSGLDATVGLELDMGIFDLDFFEPKDIPCKEVLLYEAPKEISLKYPDNGYEMELNDEVEVSFFVESMNHLLNEKQPCPGAVVQFETEGRIEGEFAVADMDGWVRVNWSPLKEGDKLVAKIVDKEGETISEAEFTPTIHSYVILDFEALKLLYESTNGDKWENNTNWLSSCHLEDWYGIDERWVGTYQEYDEEGNEVESEWNGGIVVGQLDLSNNNLTGDAIIKGFKGISNVMLQGNSLNSVTIENCDIDFGYSFTGLEGITLNELVVINSGLDHGQSFLRGSEDGKKTTIGKITFKDMNNMGRLFLEDVVSDEVIVSNCHFEDQGVWIESSSSVKTMVFENSTMGGGLAGDGVQSLVIKNSTLAEWWATHTAGTITIINSTIEGRTLNVSGSSEEVNEYIWELFNGDQ